jgi:site-specific DNA-methyltransferase (adenine-specific)
MAVRIEDAGFEIRDMIAWVYGSGFPKSLDVSKAIDKAAGAERERIGRKKSARDCPRREGWERPHHLDPDSNSKFITAPATAEARQWDGWGTALKPALEPITVARKPLGEKTVAANVLEHGTGAINVDGCRVGRDKGDMSGWSLTGSKASENRAMSGGNYARDAKSDASGRWPANLVHDGSDEVDSLLNSAARFFYCAKASKKDRDDGCDGLPDKEWATDGACIPERDNRPFNPSKNNHPTVKPTDLMRYLCRLVTPPEGIVLDPFMGSGSTGKAAVLEGFQFIGIERDEEYMKIAESRIAAATMNVLDKDA